MTTQATSAAMQEVSTIAGNAGQATKEMKDSADEISRISSSLHEEVNQFLLAISVNSEQSRRLYERRPGEGWRVTLVEPGMGRNEATLVDMSRGGAALRCSWTAEPGVDAELHFAGVERPVQARVARCGNGVVDLAFRQGALALREVGRDA